MNKKIKTLFCETESFNPRKSFINNSFNKSLFELIRFKSVGAGANAEAPLACRIEIQLMMKTESQNYVR